MVHRNRRAGEGEDFSEYFDEEQIPLIEGSHYGTKYKIYRIPRGTREGLLESHYTGYICLADITDNWEDVYVDNLPHSPGHHGVNFGPTNEGWIGFGTLDGRDHNYTENMETLEADERVREDEGFGNSTILYFTPEILHSSVLEWIVEIGSHLDEWTVEDPDIENYEATQ